MRTWAIVEMWVERCLESPLRISGVFVHWQEQSRVIENMLKWGEHIIMTKV